MLNVSSASPAAGFSSTASHPQHGNPARTVAQWLRHAFDMPNQVDVRGATHIEQGAENQARAGESVAYACARGL